MPKAIALCVMLSAISGCVSPKDCDWAEPIYLDESDVAVISDGLARDLLTHNETGSKVCGW
jgi:hypothetical protein